MKKNIREKLAIELESGFWEQGTLFLEHSNTYCVLGVLCNIAALEGICSHEVYAGGIASFDRELRVPETVMSWAGLSQEESDKLATMNDDKRMSFKQIARFLLKHCAPKAKPGRPKKKRGPGRPKKK